MVESVKKANFAFNPSQLSGWPTGFNLSLTVEQTDTREKAATKRQLTILQTGAGENTAWKSPHTQSLKYQQKDCNGPTLKISQWYSSYF